MYLFLVEMGFHTPAAPQSAANKWRKWFTIKATHIVICRQCETRTVRSAVMKRGRLSLCTTFNAFVMSMEIRCWWGNCRRSSSLCRAINWPRVGLHVRSHVSVRDWKDCKNLKVSIVRRTRENHCTACCQMSLWKKCVCVCVRIVWMTVSGVLHSFWWEYQLLCVVWARALKLFTSSYTRTKPADILLYVCLKERECVCVCVFVCELVAKVRSCNLEVFDSTFYAFCSFSFFFFFLQCYRAGILLRSLLFPKHCVLACT